MWTDNYHKNKLSSYNINYSLFKIHIVHIFIFIYYSFHIMSSWQFGTISFFISDRDWYATFVVWVKLNEYVVFGSWVLRFSSHSLVWVPQSEKMSLGFSSHSFLSSFFLCVNFTCLNSKFDFYCYWYRNSEVLCRILHFPCACYAILQWWGENNGFLFFWHILLFGGHWAMSWSLLIKRKRHCMWVNFHKAKRFFRGQPRLSKCSGLIRAVFKEEGGRI